MTQEIIEGNKLIAEFMNQQGHSCKDAYAENWNALMPVVEKIETMGYRVNISGKLCEVKEPVFQDYPYMDQDMGHANCETKIESVWQMCVGFIKWHNSLTPSSGR